MPVSIRSSFAFPSTNLIECGTGLRMTVGLEEKEILHQIAKVIVEENERIKKELEQLLEEEQKTLVSILDNASLSLKERLEQNNILVIEFAKTHSFIEFILYIDKLMMTIDD